MSGCYADASEGKSQGEYNAIGAGECAGRGPCDSEESVTNRVRCKERVVILCIRLMLCFTSILIFGAVFLPTLQSMDFACGCNAYDAHNAEVCLRPEPHTWAHSDLNEVTGLYVSGVTWYETTVAA